MSLLTYGETYLLKGQRLRHKFLSSAFRCRIDMQVSVPKSVAMSTALQGYSRVKSSRQRVSDSVPEDRRKATVFAFHSRLPESISDLMLDKAGLHMPFLRKRDVYDRFLLDY